MSVLQTEHLSLAEQLADADPVARHNEKLTVNCAFFSLVFKIIDERISDGDFCISILLHPMHGEVTV